MIAVIIVIGFVGIGVVVGLFATSASPVGYQDESGFHFGASQGANEESFGFEVPSAKAA